MGDFLSTQPMTEHEIQRILTDEFAAEEQRPRITVEFGRGESMTAGSPLAQRLIWGALIAVLLGVIAYGAYHRLMRSGTWPPPVQTAQEDPLPVFWPAPDFELTERSGRPARAADLAGRIWIADFIFTRCGGQCPTMCRAMVDLQTDLPDVMLVSFSVDPETDTPDVLKAYAEKYGAVPDRWWFLTGDRVRIHAIARDGFKLAVSNDPMSAVEPITHSNRMMLVDKHGQVRGTYPGDDAEALKRLRDDVARLKREP